MRGNYGKEFSDDETDSDDSSDSDDDSDNDSGYDPNEVLTASDRSTDKVKTKKTAAQKAAEKDGFEIVPAEEPKKKVRKLDPIGLAIGEEVIKSKKRRREIEEMSYNR